jgi:UDP-glucose 4-epimerase
MLTLIIGGAGFVGFNIAEALASRGDEVILFDRRPPPRLGFSFVEGDVRDAGAVLRRGVDCVVWGAAITADTQRDAAEPERVLETNLAALAPVLRLARDAGVRRVINLSSVAAYGETMFGDEALDESAPCSPHTLYALTKFASERLCARMAELWSMDIVSVRLSAVFGPWERESDARDTPSPFLQLMQLARRGEIARLPRPGLRDWIYAPDAARAVLGLLDAPRLQHRLYNIGPGTSFAVLDWARQIPGLQCRLCEPGETASIDLGGSRDRAPLAIGRLVAETGFAAAFGMRESAHHLTEWTKANP